MRFSSSSRPENRTPWSRFASRRWAPPNRRPWYSFRRRAASSVVRARIAPSSAAPLHPRSCCVHAKALSSRRALLYIDVNNVYGCVRGLAAGPVARLPGGEPRVRLHDHPDERVRRPVPADRVQSRGAPRRRRTPRPDADGRTVALLPHRPEPSRRARPAATRRREGAGCGGGGVRRLAAVPDAGQSETAGPAGVAVGATGPRGLSGIEPRASCLQSRRSSADLPACVAQGEFESFFQELSVKVAQNAKW